MAAVREKGFTLVELLVVTIVIGILSAISIPKFFLIINKARSSEAKPNLTAANAAQVVYKFEHGRFAPDLATLNAGIKTETKFYTFSTNGDRFKADTQAIPKDRVTLGYRGCAFGGLFGTDPAVKDGTPGTLPPPCQ